MDHHFLSVFEIFSESSEMRIVSCLGRVGTIWSSKLITYYNLGKLFFLSFCTLISSFYFFSLFGLEFELCKDWCWLCN